MLKTIAIDTMGGDHAPSVVFEGIRLALKQGFIPKSVRFSMFGSSESIEKGLKMYPELRSLSDTTITEDHVSMSESPVRGAARNRRTSMRLAIESARDGKADGVLSAGNTGAYLVIAQDCLPLIDASLKTALVSDIPNEKGGSTLFLDLGLNLQCTTQHYASFSLLSAAYLKTILRQNNPKIGLLNIGSESSKGTPEIRSVLQALQKHPELGCTSFAEANQLFTGDFDAIITDGWSGNIALKSIEGTGSFLKKQIKSILGDSLWKKMVSIPAGILLKKHLFDPRQFNGAPLLGYAVPAFKAHGGSDAFGYAHALRRLCQMLDTHASGLSLQACFNQEVIQHLQQLRTNGVTIL